MEASDTVFTKSAKVAHGTEHGSAPRAEGTLVRTAGRRCRLTPLAISAAPCRKPASAATTDRADARTPCAGKHQED